MTTVVTIRAVLDADVTLAKVKSIVKQFHHALGGLVTMTTTEIHEGGVESLTLTETSEPRRKNRTERQKKARTKSTKSR